MFEPKEGMVCVDREGRAHGPLEKQSRSGPYAFVDNKTNTSWTVKGEEWEGRMSPYDLIAEFKRPGPVDVDGAEEAKVDVSQEGSGVVGVKLNINVGGTAGVQNARLSEASAVALNSCLLGKQLKRRNIIEQITKLDSEKETISAEIDAITADLERFTAAK